MSISSGIFTAEDGTKVKISKISTVSPLIDGNDSSYYDITYDGGHTTVKESYMPRADFLATWETI